MPTCCCLGPVALWSDPPIPACSMRTEFQSLPLDRFRAMYRDGVAEITAQLEAMGPDPVFIEAPENPVWLRCIDLVRGDSRGLHVLLCGRWVPWLVQATREGDHLLGGLQSGSHVCV